MSKNPKYDDPRWDYWVGQRRPVMYAKILWPPRWLHRLKPTINSYSGWGIELHKMIRADNKDCFHSHPYSAFRLVLWGGYWEEMNDLPKAKHTREWRPGMFGKIVPDFVHRVDSLRRHVSYSLWFHGPRKFPINLYGKGCRLPEKH